MRDGDQLDQSREPAHVVGVKMRHHVVVDAFQSGLLGDSKDPLRIAIDRPLEPGIDQQRLSGRRHHQRDE